MKKILVAAVLISQLLLAGGAVACSIAPPKGDVILSVDGMINNCNDGLEVHFDKAMIEALPKTEIRTENPWDHGPANYDGVLLRDLLKYVSADGRVLSIAALNDYRADLTVADVNKYDVILAFSRNGEDLSVRDKGPLFVVFPFTDVPELATESRYAQSVWQVNQITVK
jgi:hypothetical protein